MIRLKKLHQALNGLVSGSETPFGNFTCFPNEEQLKEFFKQCHQEFQDYSHFDFECELQCSEEGDCSYQWYLVGVINET